MMRNFRIGLDLGKLSDYTALAVVEETDDPTFTLRQIRTWPLGTPYTDIAPAVGASMEKLRERGQIVCYIDGTGVGVAGIEIFAPHIRPHARLNPVEIAGGDDKRETLKDGGMKYTRVGKERLVTRLQALIQSRQIAFDVEATWQEKLKVELLLFEGKAREGGHYSYNARSGAHDDMVCALAMAVMDDATKPDIAAFDRLHQSLLGNPTIGSMGW